MEMATFVNVLSNLASILYNQPGISQMKTQIYMYMYVHSICSVTLFFLRSKSLVSDLRVLSVRLTLTCTLYLGQHGTHIIAQSSLQLNFLFWK